jgi:hypothetical protein
MLGWLLVVALGIIWAIFLFPFIRRRRSPVTTVEEFEQKMDFLAETNTTTRGRWVLTPRKGERFLGRSGRTRSRIRERRRQVLVLLLEATGLALLIGLFPPFHRILVAAALLGGLLLVYSVLLVRIRSVEAHRSQIRRTRAAALRRSAYESYGRYGSMPAASAYGDSYGYEAQYAELRAASSASNGRTRLRTTADANGWGVREADANGWDHRPATGSGPANRGAAHDDRRGPAVVRSITDDQIDPTIMMDEDVHLVVHRSDELDLTELRAASR